MDLTGPLALVCGLCLCGSLLWTGVASAQTVQKNSNDYAIEINNLVDDLRVDVSTLKVLMTRLEMSSGSISGENSEEMLDQCHRLEGYINDIGEAVNLIGKLAKDPTANREKMKNIVVNDIFLKIQEFGEASSSLRDLLGESQVTFASQEDEEKVQEIVEEHFSKVYEMAFQHIGELGEKLQDPIVWEYRGGLGTLNSKRLGNGNTLIVEAIANRVIEGTPDKEIVWEYTNVSYPTDAERLESGNTLISDRFDHRVVEVTPEKEVAWEYKNDSLQNIYSVQRLDNGNTLIVDQSSPSRVIEVSPDKEVVWQYGGTTGTLFYPSLGQRLKDGSTLIADNIGMLNNSSSRAFEVSAGGVITWQYDEGLWGIYTLQRQENGNTLVCDQLNGRVIEVSPAKEIVWSYGAIDEPGGVQRLDNGNTLLSIFGENRVIEVAGAT